MSQVRKSLHCKITSFLEDGQEMGAWYKLLQKRLKSDITQIHFTILPSFIFPFGGIILEVL